MQCTYLTVLLIICAYIKSKHEVYHLLLLLVIRLMVYMTQIYMRVPSTDRCQNNQMITKDEKAIENLKQCLIFVIFSKIMVDLFLFRTILGMCWRKKTTILYLQLPPHIWSIGLNCCCIILTFSILPLPLAFVTSPEENWLSKSFVRVHDPFTDGHYIWATKTRVTPIYR